MAPTPKKFFQAAAIAWDYKWSLRNLEEGEKGWFEALNSVHLRTAIRTLELCIQNRGTYVKAAQQLASLNHILPKEFTDTLSVLQDKVTSGVLPLTSRRIQLSILKW